MELHIHTTEKLLILQTAKPNRVAAGRKQAAGTTQKVIPNDDETPLVIGTKVSDTIPARL
jgi:hypothetical protein